MRVLKERGHEVGVQNYIDDTGVQVADVVVGFKHLEGKSLAEVRALAAAPRFDYYCWDLYAKVGDFYAADPANKQAAGARPSTRSRRAGTPPPSWPRSSPPRSWSATSRPWSASTSGTTCSPTKATCCACTSGTARSRC